MRRLLLIAALALMASIAHAQNVTGDWNGTLNNGIMPPRLDLHITKAADGTLHATLDMVSQNEMGIPVESVVLKGQKLTFDVPAVHGRYEGTLGADANSIEGTWTQSASLLLKFTRVAPSNIDGTWLGLLDTGSRKLRIAFHITNTADGLKATIDSLDQGAKGIPVTSVTYSGESLELQGGGGRYSGTVSKDLRTITGTWSENGASLPLVLKRVKEVAQRD